MLKQINATLLVLIPKVQLPLSVSDFRPIACCNVIYKAITKIIVRRMQQVLHLLIDSSQNAFVPGRSIADNVLLAQELLSGYNVSKLPPRCTIKVDIQKAYDSVCWDFLLEGLRIFNFPPQFIGWIEQCISTAAYSVSFNGGIHGFFKGSRGLRQGDPLSPSLCHCHGIMARYIEAKRQSSDSFSYHWKCKDLGIINLCFADDVLIFCAGSLHSVSIIKDSLSTFAAMAGLHVNPNKSQVILSKSVRSERQQIIDLIGFHEGTLPIKYLGVPLVASRLTIEDCKPLLHKVDSRLAGWSHLNLSMAGRVQLIKSVLSSLHMYWASVFLLPKSIINAIESRMRSFLWQGSSGRGIAKVSWAQICKPIAEGGLGIKRVLFMNQALMMKQLWRLLQRDTQSIWVAWVMQVRLRNTTIWSTNSASSSWCWKKLIKLSAIMKPGLEFQGRWNWPSATDFDIQEIVAGLPQIHPTQPDSIKWKSRDGNYSTAAALRMLQPPTGIVPWRWLLGGKFKIPRHDFIL
ncbi:UNVERIFIED_CONTAM: hypothetical protein Sradi_7286600, partial [Sesamum radiatum]